MAGDRREVDAAGSDPAGRVAVALAESLAAVDASEADTAAVELARLYAAGIDANPEDLGKLGPKLLSVLAELRLTPRARMAVLTGGSDGDGDSGDDVGGQQRAALYALQSEHERRVAGGTD